MGVKSYKFLLKILLYNNGGFEELAGMFRLGHYGMVEVEGPYKVIQNGPKVWFRNWSAQVMEDLAISKGSQVGSHNNSPGRRLKTYWYITRAGGSI